MIDRALKVDSIICDSGFFDLQIIRLDSQPVRHFQTTPEYESATLKSICIWHPLTVMAFIAP
jgi:hypothetical protein